MFDVFSSFMCVHMHIYIYIYIYIYIWMYISIGRSLDSDSVSGQYRSAIGPKVDGQYVLVCLCVSSFIFSIDDRS